MMMISKYLPIALMLSTSTVDASLRRGLNIDETLGAAFLEIYKNSTDGNGKVVIQKDASLNADIKGDMAPLFQELESMCKQLGHIEYSNSHTDSSTGMMQDFGMNCRIEGDDKFDQAMDMMTAAIGAAEPATSSFSSSANTNFMPNTVGQQKALEMLLKMANTMEEVMLVVPTWQNTLNNYYYGPYGNSLNINVNRYYDYYPGGEMNYSTGEMTIAPGEDDTYIPLIEEEAEKSGGF